MRARPVHPRSKGCPVVPQLVDVPRSVSTIENVVELTTYMSAGDEGGRYLQYPVSSKLGSRVSLNFRQGRKSRCLAVSPPKASCEVRAHLSMSKVFRGG